ncbi:hypothetical protein ONA22_03375 [Mycoplasmopsis cynos]|nr:hypothetical protein [Mycoplasmopsis cynos]WAM03996.1 hypothetical protein ONA22_03375 [Mycoplasmopsis cynos]
MHYHILLLKFEAIGSDGLDSTFEEYRDNVITKIGSPQIQTLLIKLS